jgi:hypothetical protein
MPKSIYYKVNPKTRRPTGHFKFVVDNANFVFYEYKQLIAWVNITIWLAAIPAH